MHQQKQGLRQSYFMNALLWSNFGAILAFAGAINQKMVLVNLVQDQKMNTFRYPRWVFKKFVSP